MSKVEIPTPPKRPMNAYFKFRQQVYEDVKNKNPSLKVSEHTKIITDMFKSLDEKKKKALEEQFKKESAIYKEEKAKFDAKYGTIVEKKDKKKSSQHEADESDEEALKKKKDKAKKTDNDDKKGKKNGADKKDSKNEEVKKASKAEPEAKKPNKKK